MSSKIIDYLLKRIELNAKLLHRAFRATRAFANWLTATTLAEVDAPVVYAMVTAE
jgi:hypothetical protein